MESVWNVFSRQRARVEPRLPARKIVPKAIRKTVKTCIVETPPKRLISRNTGIAPSSMIVGISRLASSLPTTSSVSVSRVSRSNTRVRRSFSIATELAEPRAERKTTRASCRGTRMPNSVAPKEVHIRISSAAM